MIFHTLRLIAAGRFCTIYKNRIIMLINFIKHSGGKLLTFS